MSNQMAQQPAFERQQPGTNGHADGTNASAPAASTLPKAPPAPAAGRSLRPRMMIAGGLLTAGLAGLGVWHFFLPGPSVLPGVIPVSGRIEGDDSAVAAKTSGRIREITVHEGDPGPAVHLPDPIATSPGSRGPCWCGGRGWTWCTCSREAPVAGASARPSHLEVRRRSASC